MALKKKLAWGLAGVLAVVGLLAFWLFGGTGRGGLSPDDLPGAEEFRSGDILLLAGGSWKGRVVERMSRAPFGHVGLIDVDGDGIWFLHASPDTDCVTREPVGHYLSLNRIFCAKLLRVDAGAGEAAAAVAFAADAAARGVPFDGDFEWGPENGLYCSELVLEAWAAAGIDLLPDHSRRDVVYPVAFESSPHCREVFFAVPAAPREE